MRIGIVATKLDSEKIHGHGRYSLDLIKNLSLSSGSDNEFVIVRRKKKRLDGIGFKQVFLPQLPHGNSSYEILRLRNLDLDIIHYPFQNIPILFPFLKPKKIVVTIHGAGPLVLPRNLRSRMPSKLLHFKWKHLSKYFDSIITVSSVARRDISQIYGVNEQSMSVVYPGIDMNKFFVMDHPEIAAEIAAKFKFKLPYILHVSNLKPVKNIELLMKAYKELKRWGCDHTLVIAGGDRDTINYYREKALSLEIDESIHFLGYVFDDELVKLYNAADVFVYPSFYESFGFPFLEAMACGCPAIASQGTAMEETGGDAGVYIDPCSAGELFMMIQKFLEDESYRQDKIQKGLRQAEKFSWENSISGLLSVYRDTVV
jgi:glycosyltransferase involved in cell wall biosynthesis